MSAAKLYRGVLINPPTVGDRLYYDHEDKAFPLEASTPIAHDKENVLLAVEKLWTAAHAKFKPTGWGLVMPQVSFGTFEASLSWDNGEIEFCPHASWVHVAHEFAHFLQFARWGESAHDSQHARLTRWGVSVLRTYGFAENSAVKLAIDEFDLTFTQAVSRSRK